MTTFSEKMLVKLLDGATDPDGDPISLRRINGTVPPAWPHPVNLPQGTIWVNDDGMVMYDDEGDTSGHPGGGSSISNGSFTFTIWDGTGESPTYTANVQLNGITTNTGTGPAAVKAALNTLYSSVGRNSGNTLKPIAGNVPSGLSISGRIVYVNNDNMTIQDYDFTGYKVVVKNGVSGTVMRNNLFGRSDGADVVLGANYHLELQAGATNFLIEQNHFDGYQLTNSTGFPMNYLTNGNLWEDAAIVQASGSTGGGTIRRNMIRWCKKDGIKFTGGLLVEENVLGPFSNVHKMPTLWNSSTSYNVGDLVGNTAADRGWVFICKQAHTNRALPSSVTGSNTYWQGIDPHCDHINPFENQNPSTCRRNIVYRDSQHPDIPVADRAWYVKATNSFRLVRNTNSTHPYVDMQMIENASLGGARHGTAKPIQCNSQGYPGWVPPTWTDNLIDSDNGYFSNGDSYTDGGNYDWTTLAAI